MYKLKKNYSLAVITVGIQHNKIIIKYNLLPSVGQSYPRSQSLVQ